MSLYMIKPNGNLGFSRIESTNSADFLRKEYEVDGYRSVPELEYIVAGLLNVHSAKHVRRLVDKLGAEMGEVDER